MHLPKAVITLLGEAGNMFHQLGREMDDLASQEQTNEIRAGVERTKQARKCQQEARQISSRLNRCAPHLATGNMELLRNTSLMLSEITSAQQPELALERYHDRRADIEAGLIRLAD